MCVLRLFWSYALLNFPLFSSVGYPSNWMSDFVHVMEFTIIVLKISVALNVYIFFTATFGNTSELGSKSPIAMVPFIPHKLHAMSRLDSLMKVRLPVTVLCHTTALLLVVNNQIVCITTVTSHELHGISSCWQLNCLFNTYFRLTKKHMKSVHHQPFLRRIHRWQISSPHKGPSMAKPLLCHDIIMVEY